jgi:hypothetical protein
MNRNLLTTLALSAIVFTTSQASAADQSKPGPIPIPQVTPPQKQQRLYKIATLPNAQANREFQSNVQYMQNARQQVLEAAAAAEKEKDPKKKADLQKQADQLLAKLKEDNEKMTKAYGFSITRNYIMEVEVSNVYIVLTDEEAAKMDAEEKAKAAKK